MQRGPLKIFYCYAHADAEEQSRLDEQLETLRRQNVVVTWYDREISPGTEFRQVIEENLRSSDIILLLVSSDFLQSKFITEIELPIILDCYQAKTARVVPILLHSIEDLDQQAFGMIEMLPSKARPI